MFVVYGTSRPFVLDNLRIAPERAAVDRIDATTQPQQLQSPSLIPLFGAQWPARQTLNQNAVSVENLPPRASAFLSGQVGIKPNMSNSVPKQHYSVSP